VAAVYVTNRMASESELTVVQATGYSAFRLARPVLYFGAFVAVLMLILTNILVPLSSERLVLRQAEISQNMTARLLSPGEFLTPTDGVTFYIRDITAQGEMLDIFVSDGSDPGTRVTYTSARAYLVRTDNGPQLVMVDGLAQTLDLATNRLLTTGFEDFAYDIGGLISEDAVRERSLNGLSTLELLAPTPELATQMGVSQDDLFLRGHDRFAQAFLGFVAGLVGFSALIAGGFRRFGLWRNILLAVVLVVLLKVLESAGTRLAQDSPSLWPMVYLAGFGGLGISALLLWSSQRPYLFKRRPKTVGAGL